MERQTFNVDPDRLEQALDLSRDELKPLRERHFPKEVLIVSGHSPSHELAGALIQKD